MVDLRKAFLSRRRTSKDGENFVRIDVGEGEGGRGQEGAGGGGETSTQEEEMYLAPPTARSSVHMIPIELCNYLDNQYS